MSFYTKIDYSRQISQSGTTSVVLSGSSKHWGNVWANNPTGYSYNNGYIADSYSGNSGYTFIVQTSGDTNYGDGRVASYGASITSFSGYASGNTVLAIGQKPIPPINPSAGPVSITASCVQLATSNLISASATDLGIDTLGNIVKDTSSIKFKYDVEDITFTNLDKLLKLSPRKFKWKSNSSDDWGYIAEEVESVGLTDFVTYEGGTPHSVKYKKLTILLIEYLKKYGVTNDTTQVKCGCHQEEFIVLTEDTTFILDSSKSKKYIVKSLSNCTIEPDNGLIDSKWDSLEMSPESCVEFRFYPPLSSWVITSSDGIKES